VVAVMGVSGSPGHSRGSSDRLFITTELGELRPKAVIVGL